MKFPKKMLSICVAALLTACGGGGGDPAPAAEPTTTEAGTTSTTDTTTPAPVAEPSTGYGLVPNGSGGTYLKTQCVKDYATGLVWEGKDTNPSSPHFAGRLYTNYDSITELQKSVGSGAAAVISAPTSADVNVATNTVGLKNNMNSTGVCGFNNWRIPTRAELETLIRFAESPKIDNTWFPYTQVGADYWTSTPHSSIAWTAYSIGFGDGGGGYGRARSTETTHVRLVRN